MLDTFPMVKKISVVEQRYQGVLTVIRDGAPIVEVALCFDVSRQAVHRWLLWCRDEGFEASKDRSHPPTTISDLIGPVTTIVTNAVNDAVRHGGAEQIGLSCYLEGNEVVLRVTNDGAELSESSPQGLGQATLNRVAPGAWGGP